MAHVTSLYQSQGYLSHWMQCFGGLDHGGWVDLSGGEPTIRKDLALIAQAALDCELSVVISTNGLLLSREALSQFPRVRWHVSIDSGLEEIHQQSRVLRTLKPFAGSLERSSQFICWAREMDLPVRVLRTCIGPHNKDALFALGERIALLGVEE